MVTSPKPANESEDTDMAEREGCPGCGCHEYTETSTDGVVRCGKCNVPYLTNPTSAPSADEFNGLCKLHGLTYREAAVLSLLIARRHTSTDPYDISKFFDYQDIHEELETLSEHGLVKSLGDWTYWAVTP
jgi:hypothetical protein